MTEISTHTTRCIEALRRRAKYDPYYNVVADEMERIYKEMKRRWYVIEELKAKYEPDSEFSPILEKNITV